MLPISVCIIAKDEENYICECLKRLSVFPWEIIVADTGSTDDTVRLSKQFTPHVHHFQWCDDFSAARNFAASKASYPWILAVDCDELLEQEKLPDLTSLKSKLSAIPPCSLGTIERHSCTDSFADSGISESVARFYHRDSFQYVGTIHEQILPLDNSSPGFYPLPLSFLHMGYLDNSVREKKALRNLPLLEKELVLNGPDPYLYFQIGQSYYIMHNYEKACEYFDSGLSMDVNPELDYVLTMVESYGHCLLSLGRKEQALQFIQIYEVFSRHADFVFLMGLIYMNNGLFEQAVTEFRKATTISFHSVKGINSYLAWYNIGVIYECQGKKQLADTYYRKCGDYPAALKALNR